MLATAYLAKHVEHKDSETSERMVKKELDPMLNNDLAKHVTRANTNPEHVCHVKKGSTCKRNKQDAKAVPKTARKYKSATSYFAESQRTLLTKIVNFPTPMANTRPSSKPVIHLTDQVAKAKSRTCESRGEGNHLQTK